MPQTPDWLWSRYRQKGLLVDSNLLLVLFIGMFDRQLVGRFERTREFLPEDFDLLGRFVASFRQRFTTPNILTELSNLSGKLPEHIRGDYFRSLTNQIDTLAESYTSSRSLAHSPSFPRFGLTDSSIIEGPRNKYLVLTDDFRLSKFLERVGQHVINFNHLRLIHWGI